jgi:hypothetical protein
MIFFLAKITLKIRDNVDFTGPLNSNKKALACTEDTINNKKMFQNVPLCVQAKS